MKYNWLALLTFFSCLIHFNTALAQEEEAVLVLEDPILEESLRKQGVVDRQRVQKQQAAKEMSSQQPSKQQERQERQERTKLSKTEAQELKSQIQELTQEVQELKQELASAADLKQAQEAQEKAKISDFQVGEEITNAQKKGQIGKFSISEGQAQAKVTRAKTGQQSGQQQAVVQERKVPALKVCATMADVNRLEKEDFVFLGFDEEVAQNILDARERLGEFKSSKQITAIEGVAPELFKTLEDEIIAVREQRLAE